MQGDMVKTFWLSLLVHLSLGYFLAFKPKNKQQANVLNKSHMAVFLNKKVGLINFDKPSLKKPLPKLSNRQTFLKNNIANIDDVKGDSFISTNSNCDLSNAKITNSSPPLLLNKNQSKFFYPEKAKVMMVEGIVKVGLKIDKNGHVTEAKVIEGPDFGLWQAAIDMVKKFIFYPGLDEEGLPKKSYLEHKVVFRLKK